MNAARNTYAAYVNAVGGTTFDGRPLPTFDELGERQKAGWQAAADQAGTAFKVGDDITAKNGVQGKVQTISISKSGNRGFWVDGVDSTGRPFEAHFYESEIVSAAD